jgi:catechol 2,3-dioxygenase-like lactoylglutathione lyase family enzyme
VRALAGRFLHVNLNGVSATATGEFYSTILGLKSHMQTDSSVAADGSFFGFDGEIHTDTRFYYDVRGGRNGCALEAIEWLGPALIPDTGTGPARPGIRAGWYAVADLDAAAAALRDAGAEVGGPVNGLVSGRQSVLAMDPDGVIAELTQAGAATEPAMSACAKSGEQAMSACAKSGEQAPLFAGILLSVSDAAAAIGFLTAIGFDLIEPLTTEAVAPDRLAPAQLAPGAGTEPVDCRVARLALPEDASQFSVRLLEHPDSAGHRAPQGANSQGLYRCALRVENVREALAALPDFVDVTAGPVWCPLPGTKIGGLDIAFLSSPDGVVFEFVERPLSHFTR